MNPRPFFTTSPPRRGAEVRMIVGPIKEIRDTILFRSNTENATHGRVLPGCNVNVVVIPVGLLSQVGWVERSEPHQLTVA